MGMESESDESEGAAGGDEAAAAVTSAAVPPLSPPPSLAPSRWSKEEVEAPAMTTPFSPSSPSTAKPAAPEDEEEEEEKEEEEEEEAEEEEEEAVLRALDEATTADQPTWSPTALAAPLSSPPLAHVGLDRGERGCRWPRPSSSSSSSTSRRMPADKISRA